MNQTKVEEKNLKKKFRQKQKRIGIRLSVIALLFLPIFLFFYVISCHSNELISSLFSNILLFLVGITTGLLLVGFFFYCKNFKIELDKKIKKSILITYTILESMYILGISLVLFLLYGPVNNFRDWLVTTAMNTMNHKHYATWFYNESEINSVFSRNFIEEPDESTDDTTLDVDPEPIIEYANEYERAVLEHDDSEEYKIITFEVNGCTAYLAVIYNPARVKVTTTNKVGVRGQYVTDMAKRENALVAINGGGFHDPNYNSLGGSPKGIVIVDGKVITNNEYGRPSTGGIIGFTNENKLVLLKNVTAEEALNKGVRDAVSWGPFLIVNGKSAYTKGNGGWGYAARTAIGQRADGIVLFLVVDSNYNRTKGANMVDMTTIMENYGAINAANLDGGTSSVMVVNGEMISHPIDSSLQNQTRPIATSFIMTKTE